MDSTDQWQRVTTCCIASTRHQIGRGGGENSLNNKKTHPLRSSFFPGPVEKNVVRLELARASLLICLSCSFVFLPVAATPPPPFLPLEIPAVGLCVAADGAPVSARAKLAAGAVGPATPGDSNNAPVPLMPCGGSSSLSILCKAWR